MRTMPKNFITGNRGTLLAPRGVEFQVLPIGLLHGSGSVECAPSHPALLNHPATLSSPSHPSSPMPPLTRVRCVRVHVA